MMDTIEFQNALQERVEELNLKLKDSDNMRESDILINEIDKCLKAFWGADPI